MYDQLNVKQMRNTFCIQSFKILFHFPSKLIKFKKHKHKYSKWITGGIMESIDNKGNVYVNVKKNLIISIPTSQT